MVAVRMANTEDSRRLAEIHVTSWRQAYDGLLPPEYLGALSVQSRYEWWSRRLTALEAGGAVLVVADSELQAPEGFAFIGPCSVTEGEVYAIYVDPRRWRGGLGSVLLAAAERALADQGFGQAILWVLEGNERGRSFYETRGWRPDGALKIEEIGGVQVNELRYRKQIGGSADQLGASETACRGESPTTGQINIKSIWGQINMGPNQYGANHDRRADASNQLAGGMTCESAF